MSRILMIDKDSSIRELYRYILQDFGHEVETADNGRDGLSKALHFRPDCVLFDIFMQGISCAEFVEKISSGPTRDGRGIPFIVLTDESRLDFHLRDELRANPGCKAFLHKLTGCDDVAKLVEESLSQ